MKTRAPTYAEIREAARHASAEIDREWPEWKKALSIPARVEIRPVTMPERREPDDAS